MFSSKYKKTALSLLLGACLAGALPLAAAALDEHVAYVPISGENSVYVIDRNTNQVTDKIRHVGNHPTVLRVSPDHRKIYVDDFGLATSEISVIDSQTHRITKRIATAGPPYASIALSADGRYLFAPTILSLVQVIDTQTEKVIHTYPVGLLPFGIEASPDGSRFYSFFIDNTVAVYDTATGKQIGPRLPTGAFPGWSALSADGNTLYIFNVNSNNITVIDTVAWQVKDTIELPDDKGKHMFTGSLTPDESKIYAAYPRSSTIVVVDVASKKVLHKLDTGEAHASFVGFSPDGKRAYASDMADAAFYGNFFTYSPLTTKPGNVVVYDTSDYSVIGKIPVGPAPMAGVYY